MRELSRILKFAEARSPEPVILATVVKVEGSHYRRVGAQLAFTADGTVAGALGGACLDSDLLKRAEPVFQDGQPLVVRYDLDSESDIIWGLGLGCGGKVTILLERLDRPMLLMALRSLESCLVARDHVALATIYSSTDSEFAELGDRALISSKSLLHCDLPEHPLSDVLLSQSRKVLSNTETSVELLQSGNSTIEALIEYIPPPLSLVVWGAGEDAHPLLKFASELGWMTTLVDHRKSALDPQRFPEAKRLVHSPVAEKSDQVYIDSQTAVVILTHNYHTDLTLVKRYLESDSPYVGLLGARSRTGTLIEQALSEAPELESQLSRLYSPVGLDIGAESPDAIALSIAAEIQAVFSKSSGSSLRDTKPLTSTDSSQTAPYV